MEKNVSVKIPMIPNFIEVGGKYQPISAFTDQELRDIAKEWGEKLVIHAAKIRKIKRNGAN